MKYEVELFYIVEQSAMVEVEANNEEEALKKADTEAPLECSEDNRNLESYTITKIEE